MIAANPWASWLPENEPSTTVQHLLLNLGSSNNAWLSRPLQIQPVSGSAMIEVNGVRRLLTPGDVSFLFNLATQLPAAGNYLEVGSWMGLSSLLVAHGLIGNGNFDARIYCVDTWQGSPEHQHLPDIQTDSLYDTFAENVRQTQVGHLIRPIRSSSADAAANWSGPPLDIVFKDGDHSADACLADITTWRPHLKPTGRLLGHDAIPGSGVHNALECYRSQTGTAFRVYDMPQTHGIWELQLADGGSEA